MVPERTIAVSGCLYFLFSCPFILLTNEIAKFNPNTTKTLLLLCFVNLCWDNRPESSAAQEVPFMVGQICCQYSNLYIFATNFWASQEGGHLKFLTGQFVNRELLNILVG
jgi:hypothetical protein